MTVIEPGIPPGVRRFIAAELPSLAHLEILLLLQARPAEWWSAARTGAELSMPAEVALTRLEQMCSRGLLEVRTADDLFFRYAPLRPELAEAARAFADVYADRRQDILELVFSKRLGPAREFSEAFRIRKEDPDGR
jgi:hypothetical protein